MASEIFSLILISQESDPVMQKRLAVLTCQLRKAEQEKETFKVATERLLQFAEVIYNCFYMVQYLCQSQWYFGCKWH